MWPFAQELTVPKPAKPYADLLASHHRVIAFTEFVCLEAFGFRLMRQRGSHRI